MKPHLVIVTGLSGAGKSVATKALEDIGYYCIDNLPIDLVESTVRYLLDNQPQAIQMALGLDLRSPEFVSRFMELQTKLEGIIDTTIVYLSATDEILAQRYSTTRRKHPMHDQTGELVAAIRREIATLKIVEQAADVAFDTSNWSPHQLARQIEKQFSRDSQFRSLHVSITSFGFKHGIIKPVDSVFDVRFLKNPHFDPKLKPKTGLDAEVRDYVFTDPHTKQFADKIIDLHRFLLPCYYAEGKHYFRIGIGCTGGQHRSVALAEHIGFKLAEARVPNTYVSVTHRDILS